MANGEHPVTPDGRYFVVRGRLWRRTNPTLSARRRQELVKELMAARRAVRVALGNGRGLKQARARVDAAKTKLGERGPVWWKDGSPDFNRHLAKNTPYAKWFGSLGKKPKRKPIRRRPSPDRRA